MKTKFAAPNVPISSYKRTKIIATIGPATMDYDSILGLIKAGANGLRLNFSHGTHEGHAETIKNVRRASREYRKPVAIIQDLQGPKIRLGDFEDSIGVKKGQGLSFKYKADYVGTGLIPLQYDLSKKVKRGERMFLSDGKVQTVITSVRDGVVHARAENSGELLKRKGINLPDTDFGGDVITEKDKKDIAFGAEHDIDYVAQSFVQSAGDISNLRRILRNHGSKARVISKIETNAAAENLEAIVEESDAVMVARGDLAVETKPESVPVIQRKIIGLGIQYAKPTIVATQMLLSMMDMPEPTRAEVSDVATAVFLGADCVMLSDETAMGNHPIRSVQTMKRVIKYAEHHPPFAATYPFEREHNMQNAVSSSVISLADNIDAKAIVAETKSGETAKQIAARRPKHAIIAVTSELRTAQQLALVYDVKSFVRPASKHAAGKLTEWLRKEKVLEKGDVVVSVSGRYPGVVGTTDTIKVRVLE